MSRIFGNATMQGAGKYRYSYGSIHKTVREGPHRLDMFSLSPSIAPGLIKTGRRAELPRSLPLPLQLTHQRPKPFAMEC